MRPRTYRRAMPLATFGAILAGATIGTGLAKADNPVQTATAICVALDRNPTVAEVMRIGTILADNGLTFRQAGFVIGSAVAEFCPWEQPVLDAFIARYTPTYTPAGHMGGVLA